MRRARKVRLHLVSGETVEGLMTRRLIAGHYLLHAPRFIESEDRSFSLDGDVEVHRSSVKFVQVLRP